MRKILAGFMATSMIVAVASATTLAAAPSVTFSGTGVIAAAPATTDIGAGDRYYDVVGDIGTYGKDATVKYEYTVDLGTATINLKDSSGNTIGTIVVADTKTVSAGGTITITDADSALSNWSTYASTSATVNLADALDGKTFENLRLDGNQGKLYNGRFVKTSSGDLRIEFSENAQIANLAGADLSFSSGSVDLSPSRFSYKVGGASAGFTAFSAGALGSTSRSTSTVINNTNPSYTDVDAKGSLASCNVNDVVVCDQDGNPMVFTEKRSSVDEDQNTEGGVQGSKTLYFMLRNGNDGIIPRLDDDTYWKLKITKGDNGKYIKAVNDVSKIFSKGLYALKSGSVYPPTLNQRQRYIKVELNDIYTDDEYKITLDMRISAKSKAVDAKLLINGSIPVTDDSEIKVKDFYFYMKNLVKDADNDWKVGIDGLMLNPLENDWNDVTWYDEDGDVAHMKFFADSDVGKFYSKLSTRWEHADYASYFNDQDAFIFNFTGSPKLSSTSRADLEIYNPFVDENGDETIDPSTAVVYQVIDGDLYDVTDSFEYKEGENGDMAFCTRTRFLGTYIICEKAVEEAVADETVPDELTPDTTEAPEDVTPDSNAGGKQPANTGKYL